MAKSRKDNPQANGGEMFFLRITPVPTVAREREGKKRERAGISIQLFFRDAVGYAQPRHYPDAVI